MGEVKSLEGERKRLELKINELNKYIQNLENTLGKNIIQSKQF